jgi:putative membrane protein
MQRIRRFLLHWVITAVVLGVTAEFMPALEVRDGLVGLVWVSLLFGLVNALIGPVLRLLALPVTLMTFGLFALVVNGVLLAITAGLSNYLDVGGPLRTIVAAVVIAVLSSVLRFIFRGAGGTHAD